MKAREQLALGLLLELVADVVDAQAEGVEMGLVEVRIGVAVPHAVGDLEHDLIEARVHDEQLGERAARLEAHNAVDVVQILEEGRLQLRQERLERHVHLEQQEVDGVEHHRLDVPAVAFAEHAYQRTGDGHDARAQRVAVRQLDALAERDGRLLFDVGRAVEQALLEHGQYARDALLGQAEAGQVGHRHVGRLVQIVQAIAQMRRVGVGEQTNRLAYGRQAMNERVAFEWLDDSAEAGPGLGENGLVLVGEESEQRLDELVNVRRVVGARLRAEPDEHVECGRACAVVHAI